MRLPRIIGSLLVVTGFAEKKPSQELQPMETQDRSSDEAPAIPTSPELPTARVHPKVTTPQNTGNGDSEERELTAEYLQKVLKATPENFQEFLQQKETSIGVLGDALSGNQLVAKATDIALRATNLKTGDVKKAFVAAREALVSLRSEFTTELQKEKSKQVNEPTAQLSEDEKEIDRLSTEINALQEQKKKLEGSVTTTRASIDGAQQRLQEGNKTFQRCCGNVEKSLTEMETQLTNHITSGGKHAKE